MPTKPEKLSKKNYKVCVLTEAEAKGQREIRCHQHRHIWRLKADDLHFVGELKWLDEYKTQALAVLPNSADSTPCHITSGEMYLNAVGAKFEPNHPAVRAAQRKIKAWPLVFDTKAVLVIPR